MNDLQSFGSLTGGSVSGGEGISTMTPTPAADGAPANKSDNPVTSPTKKGSSNKKNGGANGKHDNRGNTKADDPSAPPNNNGDKERAAAVNGDTPSKASSNDGNGGGVENAAASKPPSLSNEKGRPAEKATNSTMEAKKIESSSPPHPANAHDSKPKNTAAKKKGTKKAAKDSKKETPVTIEPTSFPRTPEGLAEFLKQVDGQDQDSSSTRVPATYQANAVNIKAGSSREIPIPIMTAGKVEWQVTVEESDVSLSIRLLENSENEINICSEYIVENVSPLSGEFHVTSVPSTIILVFDNSYSWITPKNVSYKLKVSPPIDKARVERTTRALEAVKLEMNKVQSIVSAHAKDRQAAHGQLVQQAQELQNLKLQAEKSKELYKNIRSESNAAETEAQQAEGAVQKLQEKLKEEDRQLEELDRAIKELELERKVRQQERDSLQANMDKQTDTAQEKRAIAQEKDAEGEQHLKEVEKHEQQLNEKREAVEKMKQARDEAFAKEKQSLPELQHYQRQAEALESRLDMQHE